MKVPLDNPDVIDTWEGTMRSMQTTGAFNDWIREFWFIGPAFTALNEGGQRISKVEVNSIGTQSGEKGPVGVTRWRFSHGGSGIVDSIARWAELFPADKLNRPASVEAAFRSDSQGIEVKVDGDFPGVSVDAGGGLRRILNHPLIPLVHHGMVGKFNDFTVDTQLKVVLPKGYKIRYAAPQFRSQNLEEYRWSGGAYAAGLSMYAKAAQDSLKSFTLSKSGCNKTKKDRCKPVFFFSPRNPRAIRGAGEYPLFPTLSPARGPHGAPPQADSLSESAPSPSAASESVRFYDHPPVKAPLPSECFRPSSAGSPAHGQAP